VVNTVRGYFAVQSAAEPETEVPNVPVEFQPESGAVTHEPAPDEDDGTDPGDDL
jgi:hypothetical protein